MKPFLKYAWPLMLVTQLAHATPTLYPTDLNLLIGLNNPTSSGLVADDSDSHKVYVLPPNVAVAEVLGLHTINANVGFCHEISDLQSYSRSTTAQIKDLTNKRLQHKAEVDQIFAKVQKARVEAAQVLADKHLQPLADLDVKIQEMQDRLTELYKSEETCKTACDQLQKEAQDLEKAKYQATKDRRELAQQNADDVRAYDKKKAVADALEQNYREAYQSFNQITADLASIRNDFINMYKSFAEMEGGRAAFNYVSNWQANLDTLKEANPGFQFEKIVTQDAKIFASIKSVKDLPGSGAILAYEMPGNQKDGVMELGSGFPESLSSNLVLSLVGVCPMLHPQDFDIEQGYGADKWPTVSPSLTISRLR